MNESTLLAISLSNLDISFSDLVIVLAAWGVFGFICGRLFPEKPPAGITRNQKEALRDIVETWVEEGFTIPPYTDAQYDIFEWLGIKRGYHVNYDLRRPKSGVPVAEPPPAENK